MNNNRFDEIVIPNKPYMKLECTQCELIKYKLYCYHCNAIIQTDNIKFFANGVPINCPNEKCKKIMFLVRCIKENCKTMIYDEKYSMGAVTQCLGCKAKFSQVSCPNCWEPCYFDAEKTLYRPGKPVDCKPCKIRFFHLNCPHCLYPKFLTEIRDQMDHIKCERCTLTFQYVPCPNCGEGKYAKNCEYKYGSVVDCPNKGCKKFKIIGCPNCKKVNYDDENKNFKDPENKICQFCRKQYIVGQICKCNNLVSMTSESGKSRGSCHFCKETLCSFNCPQCKKRTENSEFCKDCQAKPNLPHCSICDDKLIDTVLIPCGHTICEGCVNKIKNNGEPLKCPMCKKEVQSYKLFFP